MTDGDLTLQDAAGELGVHYMTVYRYVRLGLLPASRRGRTWVVRREDLDGFLAERRDGDAAGAAGDASSPELRSVDWAGRLEHRLLAGDRTGSRNVVDAALTAGWEPIDVHVDVVVPAMRRIGVGWASGAVSVAEEHRASVLASQVLALLDSRFTRRGVRRGAVVLGCAPGERHALPLSVVAGVLRLSGWEVEDLGADVPAEELARAAASTDRLVAVGVSATTPGNDQTITAAVGAVRAATDVPVLVGGGAVVDEDAARRLGADGWAADARGVIGVLEAIHAG